jgi:hypothetical protein
LQVEGDVSIHDRKVMFLSHDLRTFLNDYRLPFEALVMPVSDLVLFLLWLSPKKGYTFGFSFPENGPIWWLSW